MLVILLNCITLGMYQPCVDDQCVTNRCKILQIFDDFIFAFFSIEMTIKMVAMGVYGKGTYLADSWNRLDFFIVLAGALEYCLNVENMNLSAIRTIRVLRPLRAINRIPSMRILVMLLLDTLPMLGNVLLLCFFVFFIFGIVGVQLWEGILRQRCYLRQLPNVTYPKPLASYYQYLDQDRDYICSRPEDHGMHLCSSIPPLKIGDLECNETAVPFSANEPTNNSCVNWNQYYTECKSQGNNPFQGTISFDNIGLAWVAIFLVISLEGWSDIMYYVQDAHSFWDWIYFVLLIVIGSFFMINLCLVVIATQFSETKKREMERMRLERARFHSTSTLTSSTNNSEPNTCYAELVKYIAHLWRRGKRRLIKKYRVLRYRWQQRRDGKRQQQYAERQRRQHQHYHQSHPHSHQHPYHHPHHHSHMRGLCHHIHPSTVTGASSAVATASASASTDDPQQALAASTKLLRAPKASPEVSEADTASAAMAPPKTSLLRVPSNGWEKESISSEAGAGANLLSPPGSNGQRRRSSVMFNDVVMMHGPSSTPSPTSSTNAPTSSEKTTQAGDGLLWPTETPTAAAVSPAAIAAAATAAAAAAARDPLTCQELLALSGALSAALPTGQTALDSLFSSFSKGVVISEPLQQLMDVAGCPVCARCTTCTQSRSLADGSCVELHQGGEWAVMLDSGSGTTSVGGGVAGPGIGKAKLKRKKKKRCASNTQSCTRKCLKGTRRIIKKIVDHKYFQQGILLAILVNTLSMGIEYHNQPDELTVMVEISNIVFSAIFAVEMVLKVTAEGPFGYISNGFNVFDGVIVILSVVELCQIFVGEREASSGLSVLRTFRLLRILKLVRFMPNLRRQLFVMLRTMDNVAIFFSLLILFIFIFSILGMYLFGGKFCMLADGSRECNCAEIVHKHPKCVCDRKHFNNILWATVTVFQILTQEDWNVVLFNGMEKTSHWAALYFVALMTFGNYVLFNLLVAILVEGFSSERNERREREQRELAEHAAKVSELSEELAAFGSSRSCSASDSSSCHHHEVRNRWRSAEELRKSKDNGYREKKNSWQYKQRMQALQGDSGDPKCNIQKESKMLYGQRQAPTITTTAATPQDSPNTTLDANGFRELGFRIPPSLALLGSTLSIDSIDRSLSPQSSMNLLKPPDNKLSTSSHSHWNPVTQQPSPTSPSSLSVTPSSPNTPQLQSTTPSSTGSQVGSHPALTRRLSFVGTTSSCKNDLSGSTSPRLRRVCSWKLSRPSLKKKSRRLSGSEAEDTDDLLLNNNNSLNSNHNLLGSSSVTAGASALSGSSGSAAISGVKTSVCTCDHSICNGGPFSSIHNDTLTINNNTPPGAINNQLNNAAPPSNNASANNLVGGMTRRPAPPNQLGPPHLWGSRRSSVCSSSTPLPQAKQMAPLSVQIPSDPTLPMPLGLPVSPLLTRAPPGGTAPRRRSVSSHHHHINYFPPRSARSSLSSYHSPPRSLSGTRRSNSLQYDELMMQAHARALNRLLLTGVPSMPAPRVNAAKIKRQHRRSSRHVLQIDPLAPLAPLSTRSLSLGSSILQQQVRELQQLQQMQQQGLASTAEEVEVEEVQQITAEGESGDGLQTAESGQPTGVLPSNLPVQKIFYFFEMKGCLKIREEYSLWIFPPENRFRQLCQRLVLQGWFDNLVLLFIALNCITLAMERPNIPPDSKERLFLSTANYVFTVVFALEMFVKVVSSNMLYGHEAYFTSGWNIMDGSLVIISIVDLLMSIISSSSPRIFGILRNGVLVSMKPSNLLWYGISDAMKEGTHGTERTRETRAVAMLVFRLLRSLRPLRVINRAPGLKLVVQTLLSSLRPIGNIVLICCTFFVIFGILGVQLFKGTFYYCDGPDIKNVRNKTDCLEDKRNQWVNRKYNFDDLGKALMSLFVLSSRDGWVNIMYTGLDAVGVDQQPIENFSEWRLLYFISFILLVGFFVLNMFVGVVVENFHRCREEQEKEERVRRLAKRAKQMEKKRRKLHEPPYYTNYSKSRLLVHNVVTSKYFDLAIAAVIGLNVVTMAMEFYMMPKALTYALKIFNYFFTAVFILESTMKLVALGFIIYLKDRWNQLDVLIVILSVIGIVLEELESKIIPINPTIIRVMRVLRIARVLKLLKMAKGIRALLDTVMQALPQVGNLGLLFFLLFFIFAALGVELFGRLECSDELPCQGLGEHAHFANFGMAFLTLFRVATGDNWNGIMKDTLRDNCDDSADCVRNCCVSNIIAPIFFVIFVLMAQFVLVNVVVAVLMKHLEESHKQMEDEMDMEVELERELAAEQEELLEEADELQEAGEDDYRRSIRRLSRHPLSKVYSLPANFTFHSMPSSEKEKGALELAVIPNSHQAFALALTPTLRRGSGVTGLVGRRPTIGALPVVAGARNASLKCRRRGTIAAPPYQSSVTVSTMATPSAAADTTVIPAQPPAYPASHYPPATPLLNPQAERISGSKDTAMPLRPPNLAGLGADLNRPQLTGSTRHLFLKHSEPVVPGRNTPPPQSTPSSEDLSPECVSAEATLRPPPYSPGDTICVLSDSVGVAYPLASTPPSAHELSVIISDPAVNSDEPGATGRGRRALLRHLDVRTEDNAQVGGNDEDNLRTNASRTLQQDYCDTSFSECDTSGNKGADSVVGPGNT